MGSDDEMEMPNIMRDGSCLGVLHFLRFGKMFDLSTVYFFGSSSFHGLDDPSNQNN